MQTFDEIEDAADRESGDLGRAAQVPVQFATEQASAVRLTKRQHNRIKSLLPGGVPRYVRCYDNGGATIDRYTAVFCGRMPGNSAVRSFPYLAMNSAPFHPQGFGQHGETTLRPCDVDGWGFPPAMGRKNHLAGACRSARCRRTAAGSCSGTTRNCGS